MSLGDFAPGTVLYDSFVTIGGSTPVPTTLSGTPAISVYKDASTTESTAGITLVTDFDSKTGYNNITIDTSADGTFYSAGSVFRIVVTAGTVAGNSIVGFVVNEFTLNKTSALRPATGGRTLVVDSSGLADANMVKAGPTGSGTAQTARDLGASVLLSAGTGTGQLDFTSGVVKSNLSQILGTALTETAGQIAAAFKKFFNIATPTSTMNEITLVDTSTHQTNAPTNGDLTFAMIASVEVAVAASSVQSVVGNVGGNIIGNVNGNVEGFVGGVSGTIQTLDELATHGDANWETPTVPTAAAIAAATRDVNNTSPAANSLGAAVNNATAPTVDQIDTKLSAVHGSGEWGSSSGTGAFRVTITLSDGTNPVANANVRLYNGITDLVLVTDSDGVTSPYFSVDAGVWDVSITKSGYNFAGSDITVTTSANFDEVITPIIIPGPPSGSNLCHLYGYFSNDNGTYNDGDVFTFTRSGTGPAKADRILMGFPMRGIIKAGQLQDIHGNPYVALEGNDQITPADSTYLVTCSNARWNAVSISLTSGATTDLKSFIS